MLETVRAHSILAAFSDLMSREQLHEISMATTDPQQRQLIFQVIAAHERGACGQARGFRYCKACCLRR